MPQVTNTLAAPGDFTAELFPINELLALSISGSFVGTVTFQRSFDAGATWHDLASFTEPLDETVNVASQGARYRLGVKASDSFSTSGDVQAILFQE